MPIANQREAELLVHDFTRRFLAREKRKTRDPRDKLELVLRAKLTEYYARFDQ